MKGIANLALAAGLVAGVSADSHNHHQHHHHVKKHEHGSPAEVHKRAVVTTVVPVIVDVYYLDGVEMSASEAQDGINQGLYIVVGETTPTVTQPPPPSSTSTSTSSTSTSAQDAQFFEQKASSSAAAVPSSPPAAAAPYPSAGIDTPFPDGVLDCSVFPSAYGALAVEWMNLGNWLGIQVPKTVIPGVSVNDIVAPVSGNCLTACDGADTCFCSYACPPGYQKTQWSDMQGATGQSVGGLACVGGKLHLTRPSSPTICEPGAGGVWVENHVTGNVAFCRTDYPGSENMNIPLNTLPGGRYPLTSPDQTTYYTWKGMPTSAQYYVNPMGVPPESACRWTSPTNPSDAGNWAAINVGTSKAPDGNTYVSIFNNAPTSSAVLELTLTFSGVNLSGTCSYSHGTYSGTAVNPDGTGCTVAFGAGGSATISITA